MTYLIPALLILLGIVLLAKGADWLVKGGAGLALRLGLSPLVIGMTVVAFGTSTPELATSLIGGSEIAVGNVAGSNLMNIGLILGITALIAPIATHGSFLRFEMPVMVVLGPVFYLVAMDQFVGRIEGTLLLAALAAFVWLSVRRGRVSKETAVDQSFEEQVGEKPARLRTSVIMVLVGLVALVIGGKVLVDGAVQIATAFNVPTRIIALTLVAGGTSLPELATCVVAARKNHGDIALGNIVGSNIFNILGIIGAVGLVETVEVAPRSISFDIPAVILIQLLCVPIMLTKMTVARWEGAVLVLFYLAYVAWLFIRP